jgi:hypothetical protein
VVVFYKDAHMLREVKRCVLVVAVGWPILIVPEHGVCSMDFMAGVGDLAGVATNAGLALEDNEPG